MSNTETKIGYYLITALLFLMVLVMFAAMIHHGIAEQPRTNSYALLADAFLKGQFHTDEVCFDGDCALFDDRRYVILPPFPALLALPFIAVFGLQFTGFTVLAGAMWLGTGWLWWRILETITTDKNLKGLMLVALLFATPLHYVTLRGDSMWYFAQVTGVLMVSAAFYSAIVNKNALLAGLFLSMAFMSRQMTILLAPFLVVLLTPSDEPLFRINRQMVQRVITAAVFPVIAVLLYFLYNEARFGHPLENGYAFIYPPEGLPGRQVPDWSTLRAQEIGLFSLHYVLFNAIYLFFQGPHIEFVGRYLLDIGHVDDRGYALLVGCPFLLFFLLASRTRDYWAAVATIVVVMGVTLTYFGNGFQQHSVQRYVLDWLPITFLFLPRAVQPANMPIFALLTAYAMFLSIGLQVAAAIDRGGFGPALN